MAKESESTVKKTKPKSPNELSKRLKVIERLINLGYTTEEQIKNLTPKDIAVIDGISFADIVGIQQLQDSIRKSQRKHVTARIRITRTICNR